MLMLLKERTTEDNVRIICIETANKNIEKKEIV
jgi:hypothetical protein